MPPQDGADCEWPNNRRGLIAGPQYRDFSNGTGQAGGYSFNEIAATSINYIGDAVRIAFVLRPLISPH
jgi:hypothetical protein